MIYHVLSLTNDLGITQSVIHPVIIEFEQAVKKRHYV
jgi:hypothetical protein